VNLAEFAAATRELAGRAENGLASECARVAANEYLAALYVTTPVQSGALRASERVWRVFGAGATAVAVVGPNIIYDRFRNDGGTIRVRRAKVLTDGTRFFGKQVTQKGSHYMERAVDEAAGPMQAAMHIALSDFLTLP
jgi:hypothetical protein